MRWRLVDFSGSRKQRKAQPSHFDSRSNTTTAPKLRGQEAWLRRMVIRSPNDASRTKPVTSRREDLS